MTNFERIKAMTFDEMVWFIYAEMVSGTASKTFRVYEESHKKILTLRDRIKIWLKSEAR